MTTRARINIPGSRPIPPIVVRETVDDTAREAASPAPAPAPSPSDGEASGQDTGSRKASSWFEPRKPPRPSAPATGALPSGGPATGSLPSAAPRQGVRPAASRRAGQTPAAGVPGIVPPPLTETPAGGIPGLGRSGPSWFPGSDAGPTATPAEGTPRADTPAEGTGALPPAPTPQASPVPPPTPPHGIPGLSPPTGRTTGPVSGSMPLPPVRDEAPAASTMDLGGPFPPAPPARRTEAWPAAPGGEESEARWEAARSPAEDGPPVPPAVPAPGPPPRPETAEDDDPPADAAPAPATPRRGRGRARLRLALIAVVGLLVVAYGAGLLLNSDDVPRGTAVLGVDIGGTTTQEAVNRLDAALEQVNTEPMTLLIGGTEVELSPEVAGLAVDTEATVAELSEKDYSPVTVIGSLFGAERAAQAVFAVDEEKLAAALADIAARHAGDGAPVEGSVTFELGEAIGNPGRPGTTVDVEAAADAVESAFRDRAATGHAEPVELPVTTQQPLVGQAEVERAMEEFAEPAMSGRVYLHADGEELPFSPETLSELLTMEPSENGTLIPVMNTEELAARYGSYFDDIEIDAATGRVPMTPEHAAAAMLPALETPAAADFGPDRRQAIIENAIDTDPTD